MKLDRPVRAVLLDVDGTLYHQNALRAFMALELLALRFVQWSYPSTVDLWMILRAFRRAREELRELGAPAEALDELQYVNTAQRIDVDPTTVAAAVSEWIFSRPLKYLWLCRRRSLLRFCEFLVNQNIAVGVFSDYPGDQKLRALKLSGFNIWPVLCATDPEVNAFKPHPKGFLRACGLWTLAPDEVLYVGDRYEIDAVGAAAAGMPCAIIFNKWRKKAHLKYGNCFAISSFLELQDVLIDNIRH